MQYRIATIATMAMLASHAAFAQPAAPAQGTFKYCAGLPGGNYEFSAIAAQRQAPRLIVGQHTAGSIENMERVDSGDCQGGIVQSDAYYVYMQHHQAAAANVERARDMYPEYGHLICNASITELSDLTNKNTILVGPPGSGSSVMWEAIVMANPKYKVVQTLPLGGTRALSKITDGQEAQCMLFVAGLRTAMMMEANDVAKNSSGGLRLTYMRDPALFEIKDGHGRPVYTRSQIPDGTYPGGLQKSGWVSSGKAVDTVAVESVFIDNVAWADANPQKIDEVLTAVNHAMPAVNEHVLPH